MPSLPSVAYESITIPSHPFHPVALLFPHPHPPNPFVQLFATHELTPFPPHHVPVH